MARGFGSKRDLAAALNARAQLFHVEFALTQAQPLYEEFSAIADALGDRDLIAIGQLNLAMLTINMGNPEQTSDMIVKALSIAEESGSKPVGQSVIEVCAGLAAAREGWQRAAQLYGAAERQTAQTGLHRSPGDDAF